MSLCKFKLKALWTENGTRNRLYDWGTAQVLLQEYEDGHTLMVNSASPLAHEDCVMQGVLRFFGFDLSRNIVSEKDEAEVWSYTQSLLPRAAGF